MDERTMSAYSPYRTSPMVSDGRIMCSSRSRITSQVDGSVNSMNGSEIPELGRTPEKRIRSISPSHCVGSE